MAELTEHDGKDVHVNIYHRGDRFEFEGRSANGDFMIEGMHEMNPEGVLAHAREAVENANYRFTTYTFVKH